MYIQYLTPKSGIPFFLIPLHKAPDLYQFFHVGIHTLETHSLGLSPHSHIFSLCNLQQEPLWPEFSHRVIIKIKRMNMYKTLGTVPRI